MALTSTGIAWTRIASATPDDNHNGTTTVTDTNNTNDTPPTIDTTGTDPAQHGND